MRRPILLALVLAVLAVLGTGCTRSITFSADGFQIALDAKGRIHALEMAPGGPDFLPARSDATLLQLRIGGEFRKPVAAALEDTALVLTYDNGMRATVVTGSRMRHVWFRLDRLENADGSDASGAVDLVAWGPFPTTLGDTIGETVGVVRGGGWAIGLQALNPKTLGGWPWNENDAMPQIDIFESGDPNDLTEAGKREVLYRVEAAKPDTFGSTLQAYTRNRSAERVVENWGRTKYVAPAYDDGGVIGSSIALFGVPDSLALETIGLIEQAHGLPHPMIDGEWGKTSRSASAAYVILDFAESNVDRAIEVVEKAGLRYLYHGDAFETWGHFQLRPRYFPNGVEGLAAAVAKAEARGIHVGVHTLSNFITTNDPYVTPEPDPRLARVGSTRLSASVDATAREIAIEDPTYFVETGNNNLFTAVIGTELVRYSGVSSEAPWRLTGVERGVYGTTAAEHDAGADIGMLADHGYRTFLTTPELGDEMAGRIADLFNRAGLRQISFDGLEGNRSTGMGNYGEILFTKAWYDALSPDIREHYIADASRTSHFFWHIYSRMNWGEPWYAGFRESQTEYRMKNQAYFRRNYMPGMLGWFSMRAETSLEDIEWMLARSAAYDAGYAFYTSFEALEKNGASDAILAALGRWERARMAGAFSVEQKKRMEDVSGEFHLEETGPGAWLLTPITIARAEFEARERQPGEPSGVALSVENPGGAQPLAFTVTASGGTVHGIVLEVDGRPVSIAASLADSQHLVYRGGTTATVYSATWNSRLTVPVDTEGLTVGPGAHTVRFDAALGGPSGAKARLELRVAGPSEPLGAS